MPKKEEITNVSEIRRMFNLLRHPAEFRPRDVMQVLIGSAILAVPVAFTEETWKLGEFLPMANVVALLVISLLMVSFFVFYNYYRRNFKEQWDQFIKRVIGTYLVAALVVAVLLTLIQKAPWTLDWVLALKRTIIITFPASMSGAVADMIK